MTQRAIILATSHSVLESTVARSITVKHHHFKMGLQVKCLNFAKFTVSGSKNRHLISFIAIYSWTNERTKLQNKLGKLQNSFSKQCSL